MAARAEMKTSQAALKQTEKSLAGTLNKLKTEVAH